MEKFQIVLLLHFIYSVFFIDAQYNIIFFKFIVLLNKGKIIAKRLSDFFVQDVVVHMVNKATYGERT